MTRKDYIAIADICVSAIKMGFVTAINGYITHVSDGLSRTNPNFDFAKFRKYIITKI